MACPILFMTFFSFVLNGLCISYSMQQESVKIIKTKYGIYDCVDFYKQPAFNNPLLKNLTSQAIPNLAKLQRQKSEGFGLKDGCPMGTVPILRTNSNFNDLPPQSNPLIEGLNTTCIAEGHTKPDPYKKFHGVDGSIALYKPPIVKETQWSLARVKLINGYETIEAGYMKYPDMYHDYEAHLYATYLNGGIAMPNSFVQVDRSVTLGIYPKYYCRYQHIYTWNISIAMKTDGNWWLTIYGQRKIKVGYWPRELFRTMNEFARQATYGAEIGIGSVIQQMPDMGTGGKARYSINETAFIGHITVVDEKFNNVVPKDREKFHNCPHYTVLDGGYRGDYWGLTIFFGGPWDV